MPFTKYTEDPPYFPSSPFIIYNWFIKKAKLKKKYPFLADKDLVYEAGKETDMYTNLQIKLNKSREELHEVIALI
ncbi:MAG TPA: hypothetical protein VMT35_11850 [Ignavibacteriaceae bacterium]|nr:hypothetical protein [Ignavibacteriaceae bacterium]